MTPLKTFATSSSTTRAKARINTTWQHVALLFILIFGLPSCDQNTQAPGTSAEKTNKKTSITLAEPALAEALNNYQHALIQSIHDTSSCVEQLATNIDHFLAAPTQSLLNDNQQALQHCLDRYIPVHTLLKNDTNPERQTLTAPLTASIYSTPILPGYVDYLLQYPNSGIVNDITLALSEQALRDQQGLTDSGEVSIGFEVIAFLLMGEQRYNQSLAPRPVSDFEEPNANRRRQYLIIAVSLLLQDLTQLHTVQESAITQTLQKAQQGEAQLAKKGGTPLEQSYALETTRNILNTMLESIEQQSLDSLNMGYWELLKYSPPHSPSQSESSEPNNEKNTASTLATYLKWPQQTPDLSRKAFTAQLKASLQRLQ